VSTQSHEGVLGHIVGRVVLCALLLVGLFRMILVGVVIDHGSHLHIQNVLDTQPSRRTHIVAEKACEVHTDTHNDKEKKRKHEYLHSAQDRNYFKQPRGWQGLQRFSNTAEFLGIFLWRQRISWSTAQPAGAGKPTLQEQQHGPMAGTCDQPRRYHVQDFIRDCRSNAVASGLTFRCRGWPKPLAGLR